DVITHLEAAHRLGRQDPESTYDLAVAYGQEGRTEDAARTLYAIRTDQVRDPAMRDAMADAFTQLGLDLAQHQKAEAVDAFTRAVEFAPRRAAAHLNLAVAYAESGRLGPARDEALRALELDPSYQRAKDFLAALQH
ncbi:MAG: tetratricopeptide repeat protein, partial [Acidobacteriota bacterium]